jgi:RHS repeat-associated protein
MESIMKMRSYLSDAGFVKGLWIVFMVVFASLAAHAQCGQTVACVTSLTLNPTEILGDGAHMGTGTITFVTPPNSGATVISVGVGGNIGKCLPPATYFSTSWNQMYCLAPAGANSMQFAYSGSNSSTQPVMVNVFVDAAFTSGIDPGIQQQYQVDPVSPQNAPGPDTPDVTCPDCLKEALAGAPVNLATGNTWITHSDYSLSGGRGGLSLERTWNSMWQVFLTTEQGAPGQSGMFGNGWTSTYEQRLQFHTVNGTNGVKLWSSSGNGSFYGYSSVSHGYYPYAPFTLHDGLSYDTGSQTYTQSLMDGSSKVFSQAGYLLKLIDRNGNTTLITYDGQNRITQVTDPVGRWIKFNYADSNNPSQATSVYDPVGTIASYQYSQNGNHLLTRVTYADNTVVQFQYKSSVSNTLISAVVDGAGKIVEQHTYDSQRRALTSARAKVPDGQYYPVEWINLQYSTTTNNLAQTTLLNTVGRTTTYTFTQIGQQNYVASVSGGGCATCSFGPGNYNLYYDSNANLVARQDPINYSDTYTYDANGNVLSHGREVGDSAYWAPHSTVYQQYTYNSFNEVLTATDPLGHVTTNAYDTHGNLTSITTPRPSTETPASMTQFVYDTGSTGLLTEVIDPLNNPTYLGYTPSTQCTNQTNVGLVASVTDARNKTTSFCYDQRGNRTDVYDALGRHTQFQYDARNRATQVTYPDSTRVKYQYDPVRGRLTQTTDQNNLVTQYAYDDAGRLISVTDAQSPTPGVTQYTYDTDDGLLTITDALNRVTSFTYDGNHLLYSMQFPGTGSPTETYRQNALGELLTFTDRKGNQIQYSVDSLGRTTQKNWASYGGNYIVNYTYDAASRLTQVQDTDGSGNPAGGTGTYTFTYDNMNRLKQTQTAYTFVPRTLTVNYTYDAASNRKTMTDAENGVTTYSYDALNRLQSILDFNNNNFGFGYDDLNRRTSLTRPNGVSTNYAYQPNTNYLQSVLHQIAGPATIDGATYTYDNAGNRLMKIDNRTNTQYNYSYDNIYQLTTVTQGLTTPPTIENYTFDLVGNRLTDFAGNSYSYNNPSNHLDSVGSTTYAYDANGNDQTKVTASGTTQYTWDFENRLKQVTLPGTAGTATFKYDPFGRRIQKAFTVNSVTTTTNYLYDGERLIEEIDQSGNVLARYTQARGVDQPIAEFRSSTTSYYESDALGTVTSLTNSSGTITDAYTYESFGSLAASTGSTTNPFRFTGREFDPETGLYYYRARYYDSAIGRFLSEDPIRFRAGMNFYSYVFNDPTQWRDPNGKGVDLGGILDSYEKARSKQDWLSCFAKAGYCMKNLKPTRDSLDGMPDSAIINNQAADENRGKPNNTVSNQRLNQCLRFDENCEQAIEECLQQIPVVPVQPPSWLSDAWNWIVNKFSSSGSGK